MHGRCGSPFSAVLKSLKAVLQYAEPKASKEHCSVCVQSCYPKDVSSDTEVVKAWLLWRGRTSPR